MGVLRSTEKAAFRQGGLPARLSNWSYLTLWKFWSAISSSSFAELVRQN